MSECLKCVTTHITSHSAFQQHLELLSWEDVWILAIFLLEIHVKMSYYVNEFLRTHTVQSAL